MSGDAATSVATMAKWWNLLVPLDGGVFDWLRFEITTELNPELMFNRNRPPPGKTPVLSTPGVAVPLKSPISFVLHCSKEIDLLPAKIAFL